ncbi:unnamed protein product [Effrenium voratum]|uniref:Uncharacterized protein n=1 Tax=Effrenium voratum TaxID=2562239 RepID=A0AA36HLV5_9DINO|nr:unnamed protein product [Effrenium voratum]CAJ1371555.1 unnamed protein product [Effrenium voratum]CAJ1413048.1 unnamed protein product [Effrenium voratum]|mmetsp:Transcript_135828/g.321924  ORF Transcript_135828/g.321924 Transcript_135828/m.321924 type:complete len:217 (-) Transcript_135828:30-680(-)
MSLSIRDTSHDNGSAGCPTVWYNKVKSAMMLLWLILTCMDWNVWRANRGSFWLLSVLVMTNVWGWLDAVLRYPVLHDVDSFFVIKQLGVILLKMSWLITVFSQKKLSASGFVASAMLTIVLPMFYCMLLPLDENQQVYNIIKSSCNNEDLFKRVWRFFLHPRQKSKECVRVLSKNHYLALKRGLEEIAERSPCVAEKLGEISPKSRAMLRKPGRSV